MKKFLFLIILNVLTYIAQTIVYKGLYSQNALVPGDILVSTLGNFQLSFQRQNCQLVINQFNISSKTYIPIGSSYNQPKITICNSLKITNKGQLITDNGSIYSQLPLKQKDYTFVSLTIDDLGNLRMTGIQPHINYYERPTFQEVVLKASSPGIISSSIIIIHSVNISELSYNYINKKNWNFQISNSNLTITKLPLFNQSIIMNNFILAHSGIYGQNNRTAPFLAQTIGKNVYVVTPYVVQFDQQWPIVRIYDQQKFLIKQYYFQSNIIQKEIGSCPTGTFQLKGSCLSSCGSPYYHEIKTAYGRCVLTCQYGFIIDQTNKRCAKTNLQLNSNPFDTSRIKKCQRQWIQSFFGCNCSTVNQFYDRTNTLSCQPICPVRTIPHDGLCLQCSQNCLFCVLDTNRIHYLTCTICKDDHLLINGVCISNNSFKCPDNCQLCDSKLCIKCKSFYSLFNGSCLDSCGFGFTQQFSIENASICFANSLITSDQLSYNCQLGCVSCNNNVCFQCAQGYTHFVSPLQNSCKLTPFSCIGTDYLEDSDRFICTIKNIDSLSMGKCKNQIINCRICVKNNNSTCIICSSGYYLYKNSCLLQCPSGFTQFKSICIAKIGFCSIQAYKQFSIEGKISIQQMISSDSYQRYISKGYVPQNDPNTYEFYLKEFIFLDNQTNLRITGVQTIVSQFRQVCIQCKRGYGLSQNLMQCLPCPANCQYCFYARQDSCFSQTIKCTFIDQNDKCLESCTLGRFPSVDNAGRSKCLPPSLSSVNDYLKVDSAYHVQNDGSTIFYFILNQQVINNSVEPQLQQGSLSSSRLLIQEQPLVELIQNQYYRVASTSSSPISISFPSNGLRSSSGLTLSNPSYGASPNSTHTQWITKWLALIGYVLSLIILLVHCVYVGNVLLYKVDNLIIFVQTVYLFQFVQLLVGNTLAQYYYGWGYMHLTFWPDYFLSTIPSNYQEIQSPLAYKLTTLDANLLRNVGFSFSIFLTFLLAWLLISLVTYLVNIILNKNQIWYYKIAKNSIIAIFELLSMKIFYFSVTQLKYGSTYPSQFENYHLANNIFAIIFVCSIPIYAILRMIFNRIGGLYMLKRITIALLLSHSYQTPGNLALMVLIQVVFSTVRYFIQKPRLKRQKVFLLIESICFIFCYFLLFLVTLTAVNVIIITTVIFVMLLFFIADLIEVYLESKNLFYQFDLLGLKNQHCSTERNSQGQLPQSERKMIIQ